MQIKCSNLNFYLRNRKNARELTPIRCCCTVFAIVLAKLGGKTRKKIHFDFFRSSLCVHRHLSIPIYTFCHFVYGHRTLFIEFCPLFIASVSTNFNSSNSVATISISTLASILVWIFGFTMRFILLRRFDSNSVSTLPIENDKKHEWTTKCYMQINKTASTKCAPEI